MSAGSNKGCYHALFCFYFALTRAVFSENACLALSHYILLRVNELTLLKKNGRNTNRKIKSRSMNAVIDIYYSTTSHYYSVKTP